MSDTNPGVPRHLDADGNPVFWGVLDDFADDGYRLDDIADDQYYDPYAS